MTEHRGASAATRVSGGTSRLVRAWRATPHEHRLAVYASIGLFLTLFLPWYQETVIDTTKTTKLQSLTESLTGWGAFSFVEAAVLLVAAGVLILLFQRAEGHAFHLPGGDGGVITAAGLWTCLLIIWRIFDKQGTSGHGQYATTSGIEWGIFVALAVAAFLAYAGSRIRAAHRPEPPLPGEAAAAEAPVGAVRPSRPVRSPRPVRANEPRTTRMPERDGDAPTPDRQAPTSDRQAPTSDRQAPTSGRTPTLPDRPPRRRSRKRWSPDRQAAPTWDDGGGSEAQDRAAEPRDRSEDVTVRDQRSEDVKRVDSDRARRRSPEGRPPPPSTQAARARRRVAPEDEDVTRPIDRDGPD